MERRAPGAPPPGRGLSFPLPENMVVWAGQQDCNEYFQSCPATAAVLSYPRDVMVHDGSLYMNEHFAGVTRKVTLDDGMIQKFPFQWAADLDGDGVPNGSDNCAYDFNPDQADEIEKEEVEGCGDACFFECFLSNDEPPFNMVGPMVSDGQGNFYLGQFGEILKIDSATGTVRACGGGWQMGFIEAMAFFEGDIFVAHFQGDGPFAGNNFIRRLSGGCEYEGGGFEIVVGGNGDFGYSGDGGAAKDAQMTGPTAIVVDSDRTLYFADIENFRIRKVIPNPPSLNHPTWDYANGNISTIAGNGNAASSGDGGPANQAELDFPYRMILDDSGNLLFSELFNGKIRKINLNSQVISAFPNSPATRGDLASDDNGNIFLVGSFDLTVTRCGGDGKCELFAGMPNQYGDLATKNGLLASGSIDCYPATGDCYLQELFGAIYKITEDGILDVFVGSPGGGESGSSGDGGPASEAVLGLIDRLTVDPSNGDIYFFERTRVRKIEAKTGLINTVAGNGDIGVPQDGMPATGQPLGDITFGMEAYGGVLYLSNLFRDEETGQIIDNRIMKLENGVLQTLVGGDGQYGFTEDGELARDTRVAWPSGIALNHRTGEFFYCDEENHIVRKIDQATGRVVTIAGVAPGEPGFDSGAFGGDGGPANEANFFFAHAIVFDDQDNLFIADALNLAIRRVVPIKPDPSNPATWDYGHGIIETIAGVPLGQPYLPDLGGGGPANRVRIGPPEDLAIDGVGNLYIAQRDNVHGDELDFSQFYQETVVWRVNLAAEVNSAKNSPLGSLLPDLILDYVGLEAPDTTHPITAQFLDPYGRTGNKIPMKKVFTLGKPGPEPDEEALFDLRAEMQNLSAKGVAPNRIRIEASSKIGKFITGDLPFQNKDAAAAVELVKPSRKQR